jgi:hypothetical protein
MFPFQTQKESSSSLSKLTQLIMLLSVFPLYFFCHSSNHFQTKILFQTSRSKFILTVDGKGELDAKNSLVMQTPRVWPAPKISYLVPEGTQVKKEDVIVKFQAAQIETDYLNALDELEIAKAEA